MNGPGEENPWSPRRNHDLIGHGDAERTFFEAFAGGRMAHAWILAGPRGIGKATFAFRAARFVLARSRGRAGKAAAPGLFDEAPAPAAAPSLYLAPDDPVFQRVASGGHADLFTLQRSMNDKGRLRTEIVVDDAREIGQFMRRTPAEGGWRVAVVDCADELNASSANAILKILEEPPSRALLLLVSHSPGWLLPTIRSRCRRLAFRPLATADVAALIDRYRPGIGAADRDALARLGEGSVGRALELEAAGGLALYRDMLGVLDTLPGLDVKGLHALGAKVARGTAGDDAFRAVTELLTAWLGRLIVAAADGEPEGGLAEERATRDGIARTRDLGRLLEAADRIRHLLARADGANLDRRQVVLNAFLGLEAALAAP